MHPYLTVDHFGNNVELTEIRILAYRTALVGRSYVIDINVIEVFQINDPVLIYVKAVFVCVIVFDESLIICVVVLIIGILGRKCRIS